MTTTKDEVIDAIVDLAWVEIQSTKEANRGKGLISKATQKAERKAIARLLEICTGQKAEQADIDAVIARSC